MKNINQLLLIIQLALSLLVSCTVGDKSEISPKRTECGEAIISDTGAIEYPGALTEDGLYRGEICAWTIHLNSTKDFHIVFQKFDIRSTSPNFDCSDTGIRFYSLENSKDAFNYTFCSDNRPPLDLYVPGNLMTVVLFKTNKLRSNGFRFVFNGTSVDDSNTSHLATYSKTPSGLIGYPVGGSYSPSVVATWTVDISAVNSTPGYLDIDLSSVGLQTCPNSDPCSCDALVIYEIGDKGVLSTREKYCSSTTNSLISNNPGRFIIAFFSDAIAQPGTGDGFQLQYTAASDPPVTPEPNKNIPCGSLINDIETELHYKESVQYGGNERCVWILQVDRASNYRVQVFTYGVTDPTNDGLSLSGFIKQNAPPGDEDVHVTGEGVYEVRGDVAILTFHTGTGSSGFGFTAKITALFYNQKPLFYSANYVFQQPDPFKLKYPNYGQYSANEFSFFVYAPNAEGNTGEIREAFLESYFAEYCADNVASYLFSQSSGDGGHWLFDTRTCGDAEEYLNYTLLSRDITLFRFYSDISNQRGYFTISYS